MPDFIILGNSLWDNPATGGGHSSQQYGRAVLRRGWRLSFFQRDGQNLCTPLAEMTPGPGTVVMCDVPFVDYYYELFMGLKAKGCATVHRIIDNWHFTPRAEEAEARETAFIKESDVVVYSNPLSIERFRELRADIYLLRNGANLEASWHWQGACPSDLIKGNPTVGLIASFWDARWFDWPSLLHVAEHCPEMAINVFGNRERIDGAGFSAAPANVHFLGVRHTANELPAYLHHCDVGIVPYDVKWTRYNNQLKVLEYLANGLPVVSCPNVSFSDYPYVYFYGNPEDFIEKLNFAVAAGVDREFLYDFLQHHTWDARLACLLERLRPFLSVSPAK